MIRFDLRQKLGPVQYKHFYTAYQKEVLEKSYLFYYPNKKTGASFKGDLKSRIEKLGNSHTRFKIDFSKFKAIATPILGGQFSLARLVMASPEEVYQLSKLKITSNEGFHDDFIAQLGKVFQYSSLTDLLQQRFRTIKCEVCYYCNRNFITNFIDLHKKGSKGKRVSFQLDHFYPKSRHPHLAFTMNNFIPSCAYCNATLKRDREMTSIPPSHPDFDFHEQFKFSHSDEDILLSPYSGPYPDYRRTFQLKAIYKEHKGVLADLRRKMQAYPKSWQTELAKYPRIYKPEIIADLFRTQIHEEEFDKAPLSKLLKDLGDSLGINDD